MHALLWSFVQDMLWTAQSSMMVGHGLYKSIKTLDFVPVTWSTVTMHILIHSCVIVLIKCMPCYAIGHINQIWWHSTCWHSGVKDNYHSMIIHLDRIEFYLSCPEHIFKHFPTIISKISIKITERGGNMYIIVTQLAKASWILLWALCQVRRTSYMGTQHAQRAVVKGIRSRT